MKRKTLLSLLACTCIGSSIYAQEAPLWLRNCTISPDGSTIAFCYKGDIYTVPSQGGKATQITTHTAHDTRPVWSHDGKNIAFASDRKGSFDVYTVSKNGGVPTQLTSHSANEYPEVYLNDKVLFSASIQNDVNHIKFPSRVYSQIYEVSTNGGRSKLYSSEGLENISFSKDGKKALYTDKKGYEDPWRKHHQSSIARDVWMMDISGASPTFTKVTNFKGEDRNGIWTDNETAMFYLSEQDGTFNIYKKSLTDKNTKDIRITNHQKHPVRFLSKADDGTLCYAYDGEIYTVKEGNNPQKVAINIVSDITDEPKDLFLQNGAGQMAVSPDGKEIAFILRGDVYVTSAEFETTKQITNTPEQERNIEFSPDGKSIVYSSERNGIWNIYKAERANPKDKYFTYASEIKETPITDAKIASFQPQVSPDGKEVAYLEDRTTIKVINLESKKTRTVLEGKYNYSYTDGDQWFQWSPDSKWILAKYISIGGWNNTDVALVKADGSGTIHNLTESGYADAAPKWVLDGKAMTWSSDRAGYRSHGSWGAQRDMYIMFFDDAAFDKFRMSKEETQLFEEIEKEETKAADTDKPDREKKKKNVAKDDKDKKEESKPTPLQFDLVNAKDRIMRLTINSSSLGDAVLTPDGEKLYYIASFEGGGDLWERNFKENSTKLIIKGVGFGGLKMDKDGKNIYMASNGQLKKIETAGNKVTNISYNAPFKARPAETRDYIFDHAWQQVADKFYVTDIHGIDWGGYKKDYAKFLPHINNNYDFAEMLSELLGELNASHTGARFGGSGATLQTATLGAFYDNSYNGDGLVIKEILKKGPLDKANSKIKNGMIIEKIDGTPILKNTNFYPLLAGKSGKLTLLSIYDPASGKRFDEQVKPFSYGQENGLLYDRWVEQRRALVDKLSNGKLGYVHVKGMDSESFRKTYSELLGRCRNKEGVIVDTRHNGGGWLHDDLVTLLSGKEYQQFAPRGQYIGSDPYNKWLKKSAVLVCEDNYSNAHGFPFVYQQLGVGKLIGTPVPGTMTAVWWEPQIDPSIVFGIPQVAVKDMKGNYLENKELQPDILVYNSPEEELQGIDKQLEEAVKHLLKTN